LIESVQIWPLSLLLQHHYGVINKVIASPAAHFEGRQMEKKYLLMSSELQCNHTLGHNINGVLNKNGFVQQQSTIIRAKTPQVIAQTSATLLCIVCRRQEAIAKISHFPNGGPSVSHYDQDVYNQERFVL
jgi:hypothetical protein